MKRAFRIDQAMALQGDGYYYDLHNDYRFRGMTLEIDRDSENAALLKFARIRGEWVKSENPDEIILQFSGLQYVGLSPDFFNCPHEFVDDIGFRDRTSVCKSAFVMEEHKLSIGKKDMVFFFEGGGFIQLYARKIELKVSTVPVESALLSEPGYSELKDQQDGLIIPC